MQTTLPSLAQGAAAGGAMRAMDRDVLGGMSPPRHDAAAGHHPPGVPSHPGQHPDSPSPARGTHPPWTAESPVTVCPCSHRMSPQPCSTWSMLSSLLWSLPWSAALRDTAGLPKLQAAGRAALPGIPISPRDPVAQPEWPSHRPQQRVGWLIPSPAEQAGGGGSIHLGQGDKGWPRR